VTLKRRHASFTVTGTTTPNFAGVQRGIVVNPQRLSSFVVAGFPSTITSGN